MSQLPHLGASPGLSADFLAAIQSQTYCQVLQAYGDVRQIISTSGVPRTDTEVSNNLLWIGDLQGWVAPEHHAALCAAWNRYWAAVWRYRAECPHPRFVVEPYLTLLPRHVACTRCGFIKVLQP